MQNKSLNFMHFVEKIFGWMLWSVVVYRIKRQHKGLHKGRVNNRGGHMSTISGLFLKKENFFAKILKFEQRCTVPFSAYSIIYAKGDEAIFAPHEGVFSIFAASLLIFADLC